MSGNSVNDCCVKITRFALSAFCAPPIDLSAHTSGVGALPELTVQ